MADSGVQLIGLRKSFAETVAVERFDLTIAAGEFVVLLGPSGSGKTTVLSMLGGFISPSAGQILLDGKDIVDLPPAKRPTATVFQDYALFPHLSVAANVGFGLAMRGMAKALRGAKTAETLALVGLEGFGQRRIHQLSGGQRQRVALARAIAVEPKLLLLDEPLGALDMALRRQMQEELVRIQKRLGTSFVHVTHDQEEAMSIADRIVVMNRGQIEDCGPPTRLYRRPASLFTARFMGDNNILPARIVARQSDAIEVETDLGRFFAAPGETMTAPVGASVHLALRPEQIFDAAHAPEDAAALAPARVVEAAFHGTHWRVRAKTGPGGRSELLLRLAPDATPAPGQPLDLFARQSDLVLLAR